MRQPRVGLALGGGGLRGAAHVGVLKVLGPRTNHRGCGGPSGGGMVSHCGRA